MERKTTFISWYERHTLHTVNMVDSGEARSAPLLKFEKIYIC